MTPHLPQGCALAELDSTGSTNDHAKDLAKNGAPEGTVVWAKEQTAGRGRQGNTWTSLPGNLFMTLILRPQTSAAFTGQLSFLAAVALARTLRPIVSAPLTLKWPNDVLIGGKKAAGILLETEAAGPNLVPWVVIGIGVNVTDAPEGAASLKSLGFEASAGEVLEILAGQLMSLYAVWKKDGFAPVRAEWLASAGNIGAEINVRLPRETIKGTFLGIDDSGALQLELPDATRKTIASGEVYTNMSS